MTDNRTEKKSGLLRVIGSILAAAIGVQSGKNRERDFENKTIVPYVIGGLLFTVLFIATLVGVAMVFLANS